MFLLPLALTIVGVAASLAAIGSPHGSSPEDEESPASPPPRVPEAAAGGDFERLLGSRLLPGFGALLVFMGFGFLLDYAIERAWMTPGLRAILGLVGSLAIAGSAQIPRVARLGVWSDLISALGFGGAYLSLWYAGPAQAELLAPSSALLAGHAVTALALACGLGRDRPLLVSAALAAGFLVPQLMGYETTDFLAYVGHGLALVAAALVAAILRDQRGPRIVAFVGAVLLGNMWYLERGFIGHEAHLALVSWILFAFGLAGSLVPGLMRGRGRVEDQLTLVAGGLALMAGLGLAHDDLLLGGEYVLASAICGGFAVGLARLRGAVELASLRDHLLLFCVAFASIAPAAALGNHPVLGPLWCLEAVALLAFASRRGVVSITTRLLAVAMAGAGMISLVLDFDFARDDRTFDLVRLGGWIAAGAATLVASEIAWRTGPRRETVDSVAHVLLGGFLITAGTMLYGMLAVDDREWPVMAGLFLGIVGPLGGLLALTLRSSLVGRSGPIIAAPFLFAPLAGFALLVLGFAEFPEGLARVIPWGVAVLVSLTGFAFVRLGERAQVPGFITGLGLVTAAGFAMIAGDSLIRRGGLGPFAEILVPSWWALGLAASSLHHRRVPGPKSAWVFGTTLFGGCAAMLDSLAQQRGGAPLLGDPAFLGGLVWAATLTWTATRMADVDARRGLTFFSQAAIAVLGLVEVLRWSMLESPVILGIGEVSPLVGHGVISAIWAVHAGILITIGFRKGSQTWRLTGLGLFFVTAIKVVLLDLAQADSLTRVIASLVVGLAMLGASFLYARTARPEGR